MDADSAIRIRMAGAVHMDELPLRIERGAVGSIRITAQDGQITTPGTVSS